MNITLPTYNRPAAGVTETTGNPVVASGSERAPAEAAALKVVSQNATVPLDGIGEVAGELTRDDEIGNLFSKVFQLPPPPMPDFAAAGAT